MPNVAYSTTAADGTPVAGWPAPLTFVAPTLNLVVLAQIAAKAYANTWTLASKLVATDQVYADAPNPAQPASNWWPVSAINFGVPVSGGNLVANLSWKAPTTNTDGTPLTDLAGFNIYQGTSAASLVKVATAGATATSYQVKNLPPGTYFFDVTAFNAAGVEGKASNVVFTTITSKTIPGPPSSLTVSVTVTVP